MRSYVTFSQCETSYDPQTGYQCIVKFSSEAATHIPSRHDLLFPGRCVHIASASWDQKVKGLSGFWVQEYLPDPFAHLLYSLAVSSIHFQRQRPSCETLDVSLMSCISNITCIRWVLGSQGSTVEQKLRLNYPRGRVAGVVQQSPPPL